MMKINVHRTAAFRKFFIISLATAVFILLSTLAGHYISEGNLIPFAMTGGFSGIVAANYLLYKKRFIKKESLISVTVCGFIAFGLVSLVDIFNFDKPGLMLFSFPFIGFTSVFSNWFFEKNKNISYSRRYGFMGIILILPAFYFIVSSLLKFRFGITRPYQWIDNLLQDGHSQSNFNAISPFIFGGGLALAFFINIYPQLQLKIKSKSSGEKFPLIWKNFTLLNLIIMMISGSLGSVLLTYLMIEN